jgi:peptidoglycan/xylan/chitin deacetylase (PgdA/CDA1 family)
MRKHKLFALSYAGVFLLVAACAMAPKAAEQRAPGEGAGFRWPEGKRAALSLTFDDARLSQVDNGLPLFARHGVKATFYVSPDNVKERLEGWRRALKNGHEIGNHTMTHPCTGNYAFSKANALEDYTLDRIGREIDLAEEAIVKMLGVKAVSFAYPCCQTFVGRGREVMSYVPLVAKRFATGRLGGDEAANDPEVCDLSQLLAQGSDGTTFEELKALVDGAAADGRWLILVGHEIADTGYQTTSAKTLEALCRYATDPANGLWVDTVSRIGQYLIDRRSK